MGREYVLQRFRAPVDLQIDYAAELNPQQHAAVTAPPGPSLVLAGAGAGKTRTLIYRVAYLLEQGIPPENILLLTFTNKAAREMMRRTSELLRQDLLSLWGGTFHSIGNRILRRHADRLGFRPDFTILDREDAKDLVSACLGDSDIDPKATRFPKPDVLCDIFSLALNTSRTIAQVLEAQFAHFDHLADPIHRLSEAYAKRKQAANVMDFDDLLVLWLRLLQEHPDVCEACQRRFQFLLVDEYQDTNRLQSDLIDLIAARHHNIMAVGDDSQSIYSWRGADFHNILRFPERHPEAQVYRIETNYRSTPEILGVANAAISANVHQFDKRLAAVRPPGAKPVLVACSDGNEQAAFIAQKVLEVREEGTPLDQVAVLYRAHFHALELQMELTRRNIPFSITSGIRFFEQAHIKDIAAFLKLVCNPRDEMAFKRLVLMLPGIGGRSAAKLWARFAPLAQQIDPEPTVTADDAPRGTPPSPVRTARKGRKKRPPATADAAATSSRLATALQGITAEVPKKAVTAWAQFTATVAQLEAPDVGDRPDTMLGLALEGAYEDYLQSKYTNYASRRDDIEQLAAFARQFDGLPEFLGQLALLTNVDADTREGRPDDEERLRLSTVHQAKGLEFKVVFVMMLCEGLFPSGRSSETPEGLEEERRLFYVAITRAKDELYLSYPQIRLAGGGDMFQRPSRFLEELPAAEIETWKLRDAGGYGGDDW